MEITQDSFYVTLLSNSCLDLFPSNTLSKFSVKMPQVLNLPHHDKWLCGIVNLSHSSIIIESEETAKPPITIEFLNATDIPVSQRDVRGMFQSNAKLIEYLKSNIDYSKYSSKSGVKQPTYWAGVEKKTKVNVLIVREFFVKCDFEYTPETFIEEMFSQVLFADWASTINFFKTKTILNESPEVRDYFKITENAVKSVPDYLCCYCDVIQPQIIGNQLSRLLLMAPIRNFDKQPLMELNKIQYCAVEKTRISEINVLITDRYSEQIEFKPSEYMTRILLHFKKQYISE